MVALDLGAWNFRQTRAVCACLAWCQCPAKQTHANHHRMPNKHCKKTKSCRVESELYRSVWLIGGSVHVGTMKKSWSKNGGTLSIYSIINESRGPAQPDLWQWIQTPQHCSDSYVVWRSHVFCSSICWWGYHCGALNTVDGPVGIIMLRFRYRILRHLRPWPNWIQFPSEDHAIVWETDLG